MIKTFYICDKCGKEQNTNEQMWYIGITLASYHHKQEMQKQVYYCRFCTEELGLLIPQEHEEKKVELPTPPTIEDLIREIVSSEAPSS